MFIEDGVSVLDDIKVLEMENGDSCTTLQIYLIPLNCTQYKFHEIHFIIFFYFFKGFGSILLNMGFKKKKDKKGVA